MKRKKQAGSAKMSMLELIINIGLFGIISVFLLELFLAANTMQCKAEDKGKAIILSETIAETIKSSAQFEEAAKELGLMEITAHISMQEDGTYQVTDLGTTQIEAENQKVYILHFDKQWQSVSSEDTYSMILIPYTKEIQGKILEYYQICVYRLDGYPSMLFKKGNVELFQLKVVK